MDKTHTFLGKKGEVNLGGRKGEKWKISRREAEKIEQKGNLLEGKMISEETCLTTNEKG